MRVLASWEGCVTNVEALNMLRERKRTRKKKDRRLREADTVMNNAVQYLEKTPAGKQTHEQVAQCHECLKDTDDLKLTAEERLMIVNLAPDAPVVVSVIVENYEDRYGGDDSVQDEIIRLSAAHLQGEPSSVEARR